MVELGMYDASGRFVRCLMKGMQQAGEYQAVWDGKDDRGLKLASGIYFVRYKAGDSEKIAKAVLVK
jgi:flagellar hook assembly protein FlgD